MKGASLFAAAAQSDSALHTPPYLNRLRQDTEILPDDEVRALWVVRDALSTPESVNRLVDFAVQTRFHMLFVQVRGRGDAWYTSHIDPIATPVASHISDFDPLRYLLTLTRRQGIAVHAWVNVYYAWSSPTEGPPPGHVLAKHPEWMLTDARGQRMDRLPRSAWKKHGIEGQFVSPGAHAFREHMARVVGELVENYPLDGIHLDYIRYPNRAWSYDPESRTRFALTRGLDPAQLVAGDRAGLQRVLGRDALSMLDSLWTEFRCGQVDSMVMAIQGAARGLPVSAAVVADPVAARGEKAQEWARWVHQGWVDFVVPMMYSMPPLEIEHRAQVYQRTVGANRVLLGLGVYDGREEFLGETVALLRAVGVAGYALFSYNALMEYEDGALLIESALLPPDTLDADADSTYEDEEDEE